MKKISIIALLSFVSIGYMAYSMEQIQQLFGTGQTEAQKALEQLKTTANEGNFIYAANTVAREKPVNAHIAAQIVIFGKDKFDKFYTKQALNVGFWHNFNQKSIILTAINKQVEEMLSNIVGEIADLTKQLNTLREAQAILNEKRFRPQSYSDVLKEISQIHEGK